LNRRGFTMVEVIIVVAVIAVLASIIIPKMTGARDKSALESCKQNIRGIAIALDTYAYEHDGSYGAGTGNVATCYLVTGGYLKPIYCPLGNKYWVWINYPNSWFPPIPPPYKYLLFCMNEPGQGIRHTGRAYDRPCYTPEVGLRD